MRYAVLLLTVVLGCSSVGSITRPMGMPKPAWENCRNDAQRIMEEEGPALSDLSEEEAQCVQFMLTRRCTDAFQEAALEEADTLFAIRWPGVYEPRAYEAGMAHQFRTICQQDGIFSPSLGRRIQELVNKNRKRWESQAKPTPASQQCVNGCR